MFAWPATALRLCLRLLGRDHAKMNPCFISDRMELQRHIQFLSGGFEVLPNRPFLFVVAERYITTETGFYTPEHIFIRFNKTCARFTPSSSAATFGFLLALFELFWREDTNICHVKPPLSDLTNAASRSI